MGEKQCRQRLGKVIPSHMGELGSFLQPSYHCNWNSVGISTGQRGKGGRNKGMKLASEKEIRSNCRKLLAIKPVKQSSKLSQGTC